MQLGNSIDPRHNALNAIRLGLAGAVIVSHAWPLGGYGRDPEIGSVAVGSFAVTCFFAISGYLVTGSRTSSPSTTRYLWHRFLRVFPALWICLLVTGLVVAPLDYVHVHGSLAHFPWAGDLKYSTFASFLYLKWNGVQGIFVTVPFHGVLNGSLWTLIYEVVCYVAVALLAGWGFLQRRGSILGLTAALQLLEIAWELFESSDPHAYSEIPHHVVLSYALWLSLTFFWGSTLYEFRNVVPDSKLLALAALSVTVFALMTPSPYDFIGPGLTYLLMWSGAHLRFLTINERSDLSYGVYIYGFAVEQLMASFGLNSDPVVYVAASLVVTLAAAALSRKFVETPMSRLKRICLRPAPRDEQARHLTA